MESVPVFPKLIHKNRPHSFSNLIFQERHTKSFPPRDGTLGETPAWSSPLCGHPLFLQSVQVPLFLSPGARPSPLICPALCSPRTVRTHGHGILSAPCMLCSESSSVHSLHLGARICGQRLLWKSHRLGERNSARDRVWLLIPWLPFTPLYRVLFMRVLVGERGREEV